MKVGDTVRVVRSDLQHSGKTAKVIDHMDGSRWVQVEFSGDQRVWYDEPTYPMSYIIDEVEVVTPESEQYIALYRTADGQWIVTDHESKADAEAEIAAVKNVVPTYKATLAKVVVS